MSLIISISVYDLVPSIVLSVRIREIDSLQSSIRFALSVFKIWSQLRLFLHHLFSIDTVECINVIILQ